MRSARRRGTQRRTGKTVVVLALVAAVAWAGPRPGWAQARPGPARAGAGGRLKSGFLARLWEEAGRRLSAAAATRRRAPVPIAVSWQPRRWGAIDPGAPLLDMTAADLRGDGRAELAMVTTRAVLVVGRGAGGAPVILARAPLPPDPPEIRPRDPVGAVAISRSAGGARILARSSEQGDGAVYALGGGKLRQVGRVPGFPLCAGVRAELAPGRNYFRAASADWPELSRPFYAVRCRSDLVDADGRPLAARAVLGLGGLLAVTITRSCGGGDCGSAAAEKESVSAAGTAFAIADLDRDGSPEIVTSANTAPGAPDLVRVIATRGGTTRLLFQMNVAGPIAGVAAGDIDGDGAAEVVVAVRSAGSARVELWTLN